MPPESGDTEPRESSLDTHRDAIRVHLESLDRLVPREGSWVQMTQYGGGPDEGRMLGNCPGYRRLGIELIRATLRDDPPSQNLEVDLEYLVDPDSTISFDLFEIAEEPERSSSSHTWKDRVFLAGCFTMFVIAVLIFGIGLLTAAKWILSWALS